MEWCLEQLDKIKRQQTADYKDLMLGLAGTRDAIKAMERKLDEAFGTMEEKMAHMFESQLALTELMRKGFEDLNGRVSVLETKAAG